jgi:nitrogen fixation NifU-like protein
MDMGDDLIGKAMRDLQEKVLEEMRRRYSPAVMDHWLNPRNFRELKDADAGAAHTGSCGDTMEMFLKIENGVIVDCAFRTDGCGTTIVCGSAATELAAGKTLIEALGAVSAKEILRVLGGLPEDSVHCAQLAAETLRLAMADYFSRRKEPWKKYYGPK